MAQHFYPIKIKDIRKSTEDCSVISLDIPADLREIFKYKQGQYLTFKATIHNEEVRRSYSLCSSPIDKEWQVAVKKIEDGRFSTYANEVLKAGDVLEVMPPNGKFFREVDPKASKKYAAFAAGSGITPMHSIIKTHLAEEPNSSFKLFYFNKTIQSIILKEEIEGLKNVHLNRFELFHFLTAEERDAPLFNGRISNEKMDGICSSILDPLEIDDYFICGPTDMIFLIRDYLLGRGVAEEKIHFELFNTPSGAKKKKVIDVNNSDFSDVIIVNNGVTTSFEMSRGGENILDAALRNNADLPFACKGGVCCTCRAKLMEGKIEMEVNYALEKDEVEQGYILTCQAVPKSDKIVVDFDS